MFFQQSGEGTSQQIGVEFLLTDNKKWSLEELYVCDQCNILLSRYDLFDEFDSFYCMQCLDNMPSSEAMAYGNRCAKCFDCPRCAQVLHIMAKRVPGQIEDSVETVGATGEGNETTSELLGDSHNPTGSGIGIVFQFVCQYCRWESSEVGLECERAEHLPSVALQLERSLPSRKEFQALVEAMRRNLHEANRASPSRTGTRPLTHFLGRGAASPVNNRGAQASDHLMNELDMRDGDGTTTSEIDPMAFPLSTAKVWRLQHLQNMQKAKEQHMRRRNIWDDALVISSTDKADRSPTKSGLFTFEGRSGGDDDATGSGTISTTAAVSASLSTIESFSKRSMFEQHKRQWIPLQTLLQGEEAFQETNRVNDLLNTDVVPDEFLSLDQFVRQPLDTPAFSKQMIPTRKPLLTKRSHRCQKCQRLVVRAHINPTAQYREKNNAALSCVPAVRLVRAGPEGMSPKRRQHGSRFSPLEPSADGWCEFEVCNLSDSNITVRLLHPSSNYHKHSSATLLVKNPEAEFFVPAFDEMHELDDHATPRTTQKREEDPPIVVSRRHHVVKVRLDLRPLEGISPNSMARFCIGLDVCLEKSTIQTVPVFNLGLLSS